MKKIILITTLILSIILAGCSVDMGSTLGGKAAGYYYTGTYDMAYDGETLTLSTEKDVFALYRDISVNGEFVDAKVGNDYKKQTADFSVLTKDRSVSGFLDIGSLDYGANDIRLVAYKLKVMNGKASWDSENYYVFKTTFYKESPYECENGEEMCLNETAAKSCVEGFWLQKECFYCTEDTCLDSPVDSCTDTDNGIDYSTYGELYLNGDLIGKDNCKEGPNGYLSVESGTHLWENYWGENCVQEHEIVECPNGCYKGACVDKPIWEASLMDYPGMYIDADGSFNGLVVVPSNGPSEDMIAANKIVAELQTHAVRKTWIEIGESYVDLELRDVELGTMIGEMRPTVTKTDFSNLLQDSWIETNDDSEIEYRQEIGLGNAVVGYGLGEGDILSKPVLHLQADEVDSAYDRYFYSYKLRLKEPIDLTSPNVRGSEIKLFGERYTIGPESTDGLQLLKGENMIIEVGTGYTLDMDGTSSSIELLDVSSTSEAAIKVNGVVKEVTEGSRYSVGGIEVYIKSVAQFGDQESGYIDILVISEEMYIKNGEQVLRGDMMEEVEGSYVDASTSASAFSEFTVYVGPKDWRAPILIEGEQYLDSVFKAVGIDFKDGAINEDNQNIVDLNVYLDNLKTLNGYWETEVVPIPSTATIYDTEANFDLSTRNIISVGSPCVNSVSEAIVGHPKDCSWPVGPSEALIWLRNAGADKHHIVIYSYETKMINTAAEVLNSLETIDMPDDTKILKVTSHDGISISVEALEEWELYQDSVTCNPDSLIGDANADGVIDSNDVRLIEEVILGTKDYPENICCIDVNKDDSVNVIDLNLLQSYINGEPSEVIGQKCSSGVCTDTDGGKDYTTQGSTTGGSGGAMPYTLTDRCLDEYNMLESYCGEGGFVKREKVMCLDGCNAGACNSDRTCADTDDRYDTEYKQYFRAGNTTALGVTKEDACTVSTCEVGQEICENEYFVREWTCNKESPTGMLEVVAECEYGCENGACVEYESCSDDEVGADPDIKGHISIESTNMVERFYEDDEDNILFNVKNIDINDGEGEAIITFYDTKETLNIVEGRTYSAGFLEFEVLDIYVNPSDSTKDYVELNIKGISDVCDKEGNLLEFTCVNNDMDSAGYECPNGCVDGACVDETIPGTCDQYITEEECVAGSCLWDAVALGCVSEIPPHPCTDSDGGLQYFKKGVASIEGCVGAPGGKYCGKWDMCSQDTPGILIESYCENGWFTDTIYDCPGECLDGACV